MQKKKSVRNAHTVGIEQYNTFNTSRKSLYYPIKKNNLDLFRQKNVVASSKSKQKIVTLKERCNLFKDFYISCQTRQGNLDMFFAHMNLDFPPSLSECGRLYHPPTKSDILDCLKSVPNTQLEIYNPPEVDACVIDGPAWVHMHPPRSSKTFEDYCCQEILASIARFNIKRVDFVFDVYLADSLKREERKRRGNEICFAVRRDTAIPKNFAAFLCNDRNKTQLFELISNLVCNDKERRLTIVSTKGETVISNKAVAFEELSPCNQEEADTRIFIHAKDLTNQFQKIKVVTVDSDVVVIALYVFFTLRRQKELQELWIEFGVGRDKKWIHIHIHSYAEVLGEDTCMALTFFHAFTGSDTTSQFAGRAKKTAWKTWQALPETTETFIRLSTLNDPSQIDKRIMERFVCVMYGRGTKFSCVNECRKYLFTKMSRSIENCPPTSNVLEQHIKRAQLQSSIWDNVSDIGIQKSRSDKVGMEKIK